MSMETKRRVNTMKNDFATGMKKIGEAMSAVISAEVTARAAEERENG